MRAIAIAEFGGPELLRPVALPRPRPARGEVLVRVVAAGVNPVDCQIRRGELREAFDCRFPLVPGWDAAGVLEELGEGATRFRKGDRVFLTTRARSLGAGCYAEYVAVPERHVALMPGKLLFEEAAAVPLAALTARQCLARAEGLGPEATVLVGGAGGGVGHFAVQLARHAGARVLGIASSAKLPLVLSLGAAAGIDADGEPAADVVRRHAPDGVDLAIDTVGGARLAALGAAVREGGRLVSIVDEPDPDAAARGGYRAESLMSEPDGDQLAELARLFDRGALRVTVQKIFRLQQAPAAHRTQETREVAGKLVLNL